VSVSRSAKYTSCIRSSTQQTHLLAFSGFSMAQLLPGLAHFLFGCLAQLPLWGEARPMAQLLVQHQKYSARHRGADQKGSHVNHCLREGFSFVRWMLSDVSGEVIGKSSPIDLEKKNEAAKSASKR